MSRLSIVRTLNSIVLIIPRRNPSGMTTLREVRKKKRNQMTKQRSNRNKQKVMEKNQKELTNKRK